MKDCIRDRPDMGLPIFHHWWPRKPPKETVLGGLVILYVCVILFFFIFLTQHTRFYCLFLEKTTKKSCVTSETIGWWRPYGLSFCLTVFLFLCLCSVPPFSRRVIWRRLWLQFWTSSLRFNVFLLSSRLRVLYGRISLLKCDEERLWIPELVWSAFYSIVSLFFFFCCCFFKRLSSTSECFHPVGTNLRSFLLGHRARKERKGTRGGGGRARLRKATTLWRRRQTDTKYNRSLTSAALASAAKNTTFNFAAFPITGV